jgi:cAMP-regulated phosphoprotein/endosulfine conserved region
MAKHLKERKYFDSGDYALSKAGKASSVDTGSVGSQHPLPENIPHLSSPGVGGISGGSGNSNIQMGTGGAAQSCSPVKESSFLNRETSADEIETEEEGEPVKAPKRFQNIIGPPTVQEGIPIRR